VDPDEDLESGENEHRVKTSATREIQGKLLHFMGADAEQCVGDLFFFFFLLVIVVVFIFKLRYRGKDRRRGNAASIVGDGELQGQLSLARLAAPALGCGSLTSLFAL